MVRPWVYKSLAIALRESQGSADEIERAETASAELEPIDGQGFLDASRAIASDKRWDGPGLLQRGGLPAAEHAYAYNEALLYAELAQDEPEMESAAGHLLSQDWPVGNKELQDDARRKAEAWPRSWNPRTARATVKS